METVGNASMPNGGHLSNLRVGRDVSDLAGGTNFREHRRPMWTQHEKTVLRLLMREYAGVTEFDPPDIHKHPIKNEMWRLLTARYNDHPNVRTRDTKQLRKAWENLKYRARKLGCDIKKNGTTAKRLTGSAQDSVDAPWPLDGVNFSFAGGKDSYDVENQDMDVEEDSKSIIIEDELKEVTFREEKRRTSAVISFQGEKSHSGENSALNASDDIYSTSKFDSLGGSFSTYGRGAVINLQPLVNSLVGGALPALIPFLSPPNPSLASDFLFNGSFNHSFAQPSDDCPSEASCPREDNNGRPYSSHLPLSPNHWSSAPGNTEAKPKEEDSPYNADEGVIDYSASSGSPNSSEPPEITIMKLLRKKNNEEEKHTLTVQLLKMQLSNAENEHEIKMKLLETQLEYWQTKLKNQQCVNDQNEQTNDEK